MVNDTKGVWEVFVLFSNNKVRKKPNQSVDEVKDGPR